MIKNFFIFLFSILLLCGCCNKNDQEILTFTSWGSITEVKVLKKIISDYELENPDIKINFIHTPQNYFQKLHLLFASNTAPDVIFINNIYLPLYEAKLMDLSEIINKKEFYPQAINCLSYGKKVLAIPRDISNLVLYINTDIVSINKIHTLDELLNIAKVTTSNKIWGIGFEEDIYWALPYLAYFDEEFNIDFNPKTSHGLNFYKDLRNKHKVAPTKAQIGSSTITQMFLDKKLAILLSGRWMYPKIKEKADFNWIVTTFPQGKGALPCDASGWAISKNTKHKDAAIKFVTYLSSEKNAKHFAETGLIVPARIEASKILNNNYHNERAFLETIEASKSTPVSKNYKQIADKFNTKEFN